MIKHYLLKAALDILSRPFCLPTDLGSLAFNFSGYFLCFALCFSIQFLCFPLCFSSHFMSFTLRFRSCSLWFASDLVCRLFCIFGGTANCRFDSIGGRLWPKESVSYFRGLGFSFRWDGSGQSNEEEPVRMSRTNLRFRLPSLQLPKASDLQHPMHLYCLQRPIVTPKARWWTCGSEPRATPFGEELWVRTFWEDQWVGEKVSKVLWRWLRIPSNFSTDWQELELILVQKRKSRSKERVKRAFLAAALWRQFK